MMKAVYLKEKPSYTEISQQTPIKFSILYSQKRNLIQVTDFFKCTDFFIDALFFSYKKRQGGSIYGFVYPGDKYPIYGVPGYLLIKTKKPLDLTAIHSIERKYKIARTEILGRENEDTAIKYSAIWNKSPVLLHLYAFMHRISYELAQEGVSIKPQTSIKNFFNYCYENHYKDLFGSDSCFLKHYKNSHILDFLMIKRKKAYLENLPEINDSPYDLHNHSGIKTFTRYFNNSTTPPNNYIKYICENMFP